MSSSDGISGYFTTAESYRAMSELLSPKGVPPQSIETLHASYADRYAHVCGETHDGHLTQAIRGFFQAELFVEGGTASPADKFEYYLQRNNCPEGSPTKIAINDIVQRYASLSQRTDHPAIPRIRTAVEKGDVRNGDLTGLKTVAGVLETAPNAWSALAYTLLDLVVANNFLIPPHFGDLADEVAWGFDPAAWSNTLRVVLKEATLVNSPSTISDAWQRGVKNAVLYAAGGRFAFVRSLLVLLGRGETLLARKILYFLRVNAANASIQRSLEIFLHAAAAGNSSRERLFLMDQTIKLVAGAYVPSNLGFPDLVDPLIALMGFEESYPKAEEILGKLVEKLVAYKKMTPEKVQIANTVGIFAKYLKDLYLRMLKDGLDRNQRMEGAENSVVIWAIRTAEFVRFDIKYMLEIERVLRMDETRARKILGDIIEKFTRGGGPRGGGSLSGLPPSSSGVLPPAEGAPPAPDMSGFGYEADVEEITYWDESIGTDEIYAENDIEDYDYGEEDPFLSGAETYFPVWQEPINYFDAAIL